MTTYLAVAAATWGIAMALAPLLQMRAILRARTAKAVSVAYLRVLLVGFILWLAYGIASHDLALIVPNTVATIVVTATILVALRYRAP